MDLVTLVYRKALVPVIVTVALLSAASAALLAFGDKPRMEAVDPGAMQVVVVSTVTLLGVVLPLVLLASRRVRADALLRVPIVCLGAVLAHEFARNPLIVVPLQQGTSLFAEVVAGLFLMVSLVVFVDRRSSARASGAFSR